MTTKEKAISVINPLSDDAMLDDVIDRLCLLRKIVLGIAQADAGEVMEHDEFMAELEREDANQRSAGRDRVLTFPCPVPV
jgi:hypothetical protein